MVGILVIPLLLSGGELGVAEGLSGKAKLDAVLGQISAAQANVRTLSARFRQSKVSHLLKEPSISEGQFFFAAPNRLRWDYQHPKSFVVLITGKHMITYRPAENLAEKVELGRNQRKVFAFLSAAEPVSSLTRHFSLTFRDPGGQENYVLMLRPVTHYIKKRLRELTLVVDRRRFLPVKVAYSEADGDLTTYEFSEIVVNEGLPQGFFSLDLPAGVRVVEVKLRGAE
ncbi:MAG: LolA family protein [Thermoanaerobaculaceae bacterium]